MGVDSDWRAENAKKLTHKFCPAHEVFIGQRFQFWDNTKEKYVTCVLKSSVLSKNKKTINMRVEIEGTGGAMRDIKLRRLHNVRILAEGETP